MANGWIDLPPRGSPSWRAPVADVVNLPAIGNTLGDAIVTQDTSNIYVWNGTAWILASGGGGGGSGTVTSVSFVNGGGFTGTVTNPTINAALSLIGTLTGDITGPLTATQLTATTNSTLTTLSALSLPYSQLSGTVPTWNQNTTGTASNITATSNATLTTLPALSLPYSQITGAPGGTVTAVTATTPLASSGGTAPNLTIQQATALQAGYLSAADWTTFNSKQAAGNYITALTGNVVAAGPGSVTATIQPNVVTNSMLAQAPAMTIKGNNTAGTANELDLTAAQVVAMLPPFTGDSGTGGVQGDVPAPPALSYSAGDYLSASGSWKYVDQSKPIYPPFSLVSQNPNPGSTPKIQNVITYTATNGKQYAVVIAGTVDTLTLWDITDQAAPVIVYSFTTLLGSYNAVHALISGVDYIIIGSSGGYNLYIINVSNPYAPVITTTFNLTSATGSTYNITYQNGYVYLACQTVGLKVIDIGGGLAGGTLLAPVVSYTQGAAKSFGVVVTGNTLYTTQYSTSPYATRLLNSWTLTGAGTAAVPSLVQSLTLPGLGETLAVSINATTAFVSNTTGVQQVDVVDITNPAAMANITSIPMPSGYTISPAMVAIPYGNFLFMPVGSNATYGGTILMYDITNRAFPTLVSSVSNNVATSPFGGIAIQGQYIYAADYGPSPGNNGNLDIFTMPLTTPVFGLATGSTLNLSSPAATLTGSAGTAVLNQPFQGTGYKKVAIYLNGYTDTGTQTYTFPTAFTHTPYVYGLTAGVAGATVTTTTVTFTVTAQTGFVFLEGY